MKDIQKIKEFFSKPTNESLTAGYPHRKTSGEDFERIDITEPMDDATKNKMIKNFRAAGWDAKPNNGGGITAIKKAMMEAKKEDAVDTITMDIPLFLRMLEYSREDASQDMDLHDVTEKANVLGKEKGILSMEDYDAIVGAAEEIGEARRQVHPVVMQSMIKNASNKLKKSKLSPAEYQEVKKLKDFKESDWKWNADEDLYTKVTEATDYMKRRETDDYAVSKKDKPKKPYNPTYSGKTDYMKRREKELAEAILAKLKK